MSTFYFTQKIWLKDNVRAAEQQLKNARRLIDRSSATPWYERWLASIAPTKNPVRYRVDRKIVMS